ncbi:Protein of unknown function [Gryllus bimaculatus]|nr:Protein of unknown function [Gryllus bimaculatus]
MVVEGFKESPHEGWVCKQDPPPRLTYEHRIQAEAFPPRCGPCVQETVGETSPAPARVCLADDRFPPHPYGPPARDDFERLPITRAPPERRQPLRQVVSYFPQPTLSDHPPPCCARDPARPQRPDCPPDYPPDPRAHACCEDAEMQAAPAAPPGRMAAAVGLCPRCRSGRAAVVPRGDAERLRPAARVPALRPPPASLRALRARGPARRRRAPAPPAGPALPAPPCGPPPCIPPNTFPVHPEAAGSCNRLVSEAACPRRRGCSWPAKAFKPCDDSSGPPQGPPCFLPWEARRAAKDDPNAPDAGVKIVDKFNKMAYSDCDWREHYREVLGHFNEVHHAANW